MLKKVLIAAVVLAFVVAFGRGASALEPIPPSAQDAGADLLRNGHFDIGGFYWRPPNHFVASGWFEWWAGPNLPEFLDGGIVYHNICYPLPTDPSGLCTKDKNHSQGYIRWGGPYIAGVYQPVSVTACAIYRFEAYNRNDADNYHPKVGIDPTGWRLPVQPGSDPLMNCPPDGMSKCPKPILDSPNDFPSTMVWSPEFDHPGMTWASQSVAAEAVSTTISVWTYVAPDEAGIPSRSTYWDYASLVQVAPETLLPDKRIPEPDGKLSTPTYTSTLTTALIRWTTSQPAFSQVYYKQGLAPTVSPCPPGSACLVHSIYLPIVGRGPAQVGEFSFKTVPTLTPASNQSVMLTGLEPDTTYDYVVVSRWLENGACNSSASAIGAFTTQKP